MSTSLPVGLIMIGLSVFMLLIAAPRSGEQARFLRGRDTLEAAYSMLMLGLLIVGGILALSNWG